MSWEGRIVTGRDDFILSLDRDGFKKAGVREAGLRTDYRMYLKVL